jgi:hypothetical protein
MLLFFSFCDLDLELGLPLFLFKFRKSYKLGGFHAHDTTMANCFYVIV